MIGKDQWTDGGEENINKIVSDFWGNPWVCTLDRKIYNYSVELESWILHAGTAVDLSIYKDKYIWMIGEYGEVHREEIRACSAGLMLEEEEFKRSIGIGQTKIYVSRTEIVANIKDYSSSCFDPTEFIP